MKALEILVRITRTPQNLFRYLDKKLDEAIAELEALQSRSCEGCRFHDDDVWDDWCCDCIRRWTIDRYEPKER